jgi:hypothetical protein
MRFSMGMFRAGARFAVLGAALVPVAFGVTASLGDAAAAQAGQPGNGRSRHAKSCSQQRSYLQSRTVRIYRRTVYDQGYSDGGVAYLACLRPRGRSIQVAVDLDSGEYPPPVALQQITVQDDYAAALSVLGEEDQAACEKYTGGTNCPSPTDKVNVVDVRARKAASVTLPDNTTGLVLSSAGAVAWLVPASGGVTLQAGAVHRADGRLTLSSTQYDTGTITHVRLHALVLTWNSGGQSHAATL